MKAPDAGYYGLRVNLVDKSHSFTLTHRGLIGSATANGWDSDQNRYETSMEAVHQGRAGRS